MKSKLKRLGLEIENDRGVMKSTNNIFYEIICVCTKRARVIGHRTVQRVRKHITSEIATPFYY